ncbi:MAG: leucine-rich repeat protein [Eubacteriales bacterium]|nr:leucine-rich repeat protein [Eubacteriales bacterium]
MKKLRSLISLLLVLILLLSALLVAPTANAAGVTVKLDATCRYDYAFEILDRVNKLRSDSGVGTLKMNETLLNNAMQRAAEIAVKYDHTRPDGSTCFTINSKINAENITFTYVTPAKAMKSWTTSSAHLANMMNKDFKSMGVGCVVQGGTYYWVQVFSKSNLTKLSTIPENVDKTFNVSLGSKKYTYSLSLPSTIYITDTEGLDVLGKNPLTNDTYFNIDGSNFTLTSSNEDVISLDGTTATALSEGTSTITAKGSVGSVSLKVKVVEYGKGQSHQCGDNVTWEYNNRTLTFTGTGDMYDYSATRNDKNDVISSDVPWADGVNHVKKIVVGDGITSIGNSSFACFNKLTDVELPDTLTKIGDTAFASCAILSNISIPDNVTTIGEECFVKCPALTSVHLSNSLESISPKMFFSCRALESVNLPDSLKSIKKNAFGYCTELTDFPLPQNLTFIDEYAFYGCEGFTELTIPYIVESLNQKTFNDCKSLKKLTILNPTLSFTEKEMLLNVPSTLTVYGYKNSSAEKFCKEKKINFVELEGFDLTVTAEGYSTAHTGEAITDNPSFSVSETDDFVVRYSKGDTFNYADCFSSIEELGHFYRNHVDYYSKIPNYLIDKGEYTISYCVYARGSNPSYGTMTINIIDCLRGDTDGDGEISVLDASIIQLFLVGKKNLEGNATIAADFDEDGDISVLDASAIQLWLVGKL